MPNIILIYPQREGEKALIKKDSLSHHLEKEEPIKVQIRTLKISNIFDSEKNRINEDGMLSEINKALELGD